MNVANQVLTQMPIRMNYGYFQPGSTPLDTVQTIELAIFAGLALAVYPAFFALYPTLERVRQVRALQYSNGIRSAPLWIAYFAFDFVFVVIISIVIVVIWPLYWNGWFAIGYLWIALVLFGLASTAYSYCCSLLVHSQLGAFAASAGTQCLLTIVYFVTYAAESPWIELC